MIKYAILTITILGILLFGLPALGLFNLQFWAPKYQDAKRNVFENTNSYVRGNQRDMENLFLAYKVEKDLEAKAAILDTLRHRVNGLPAEQVPQHITQLLNQPIGE